MERLKHSLKSGIYQIKSKINGKIYIGSTVNLKRRKNEHFCSFYSNTHYNSYLQNHYNKYGLSDLLFEIVEFCSRKDLILREQYWIDILKPEFNIAKDAKSPMMGKHHTKESKLKTRKHHLEYYQTKKGKESIQKFKISKAIFYQSKEGVLLKQKISRINSGKNSPMKVIKNRKINSEGHKQFYQTEQGKEVIRKHSEYMKKFYQTERGKENRKKYSENHPTKRMEVRQKMRESQKAYLETEEGKKQKINRIEILNFPENRMKQLESIRTPESLERRRKAAMIGWEKRKRKVA